MNIGRHARRSAGAGAAIAALLAIVPAANADVTPVFSTSCGDPSLSQPFVAWGDSTCYGLAPGEAPDSFSGTGWTLSSGASIVTTTLFDGTQGSVLDLPPNATAVSPVMWVDMLHPYLRAMLSSVNHGGARVSIAYLGVNGLGPQHGSGALNTPNSNWTLSNRLNMPGQPGQAPSQQVQLTLVGTGSPGPVGKTGDFRLYNLYYLTASSSGPDVFTGDPRMKG